MDANGDGKLTKEEYRSFLESAKSKVQAKTGKAAKAGGKGGKLADKIFEMMDTNKDGVVSKEEFLKFDPSTARRAKGKGRKN
jgi:Ca2+-binding EF-hand superfamily protein